MSEVRKALLGIRDQVADWGQTYHDGQSRNRLSASRLPRAAILDIIDAALAATPAPREGDWAELRRLAEAAREAAPGPWLFVNTSTDSPGVAFVNAVSPDVVLRLIAAVPPPERPGTETRCPLEGVHEHAFRGPHRFREWEPGA